MAPKTEKRTSRRPAQSSAKTRQTIIGGARLVELVNRMALEADRDERQLRELIRALIAAGRTKEADRLLAAWDHRAAGDVLRQHTGCECAETG